MLLISVTPKEKQITCSNENKISHFRKSVNISSFVELVMKYKQKHIYLC